MKSDSMRKTIILLFSFASLLGIAAGVSMAIRSPLFLVQVVEVGDQPESAPVDAQTISDLAAVPVGKVSLFALDLHAVEKRILTHPWIRKVTLVKRFPQTLSINVEYRDPQALLQNKNGGLSYVDTDGRTFGHVNVLARSDLPMISGVDEDDSAHMKQALDLVGSWKKAGLGKFSQISSLSWDQERGFRAWVVYALQDSKARTVVELGDETPPEQFQRLGSVIQYLSLHHVASRQIWADSGKKIVVRTTQGS